MKADAKKVLIAMIQKSADNSASDLLAQKEVERIEGIRRAAFLKALYANPALYLELGEYDEVENLGEIQLTKAAQKLCDSIVKANPTREDEQTEYVTFNALSLTLNVTKSQVKKYQRIADEIDVAVVSGEAVDLYNLLKKALS